MFRIMNLHFNLTVINQYTSPSQKSRVMTERWVQENAYCPSCNNDILTPFSNNTPVGDFFCSNCQQEYELKSKNGSLSKKITDGAYNTMIKRINSNNNPNFFFLTYDKLNWKIRDFLIIPRHYFVEDLIEKRVALKGTARRAGWVGCNILIGNIPSSGRIFLIKDCQITDRSSVIEKWQKTEFLKNKKHRARGWVIEILKCIDAIPTETFKLADIYKFESNLKLKYPNNNFIKDKIRQQLQLLRDENIIEFISPGIYKKTKMSL